MDANNFLEAVGVGEREGRVHSALVRERNFGLSHGLGRSGDISAEQPKAAGSSLLAKICNFLTKDALELAGYRGLGSVCVLPLATGMALTMSLLALKAARPAAARYVIWPRIDQKTCVKCVAAAGMELVVIPGRLEGHQLRTDTTAVEQAVSRLGADRVVCILSTTSCFTPRAPDDVAALARAAQAHGVGHIINNAYGVQCQRFSKQVSRAWTVGRVDAVVQSTDKNFMVPVGGAVLSAPKGEGSWLVDSVAKSYPGRACASPILDLLITLLSLGAAGWQGLLLEREAVFAHLRDRLEQFAEANGQVVLDTPDNHISLAMTLDGARGEPRPELLELGSMLFLRNVTGARVFKLGRVQEVAGTSFAGFGSHHDRYPHPYLNVAAAIGMGKGEVDVFFSRLQKCWARAEKTATRAR